MVFIKKNFYLASNFDYSRGKKAVEDLNRLLENVGVEFSLGKVGTGYKIFITVKEEMLHQATNTKAGRPIKHNFDIAEVERMKASGMNNKQIYESLGMSKSLFYLKMKEYKNNIGQ